MHPLIVDGGHGVALSERMAVFTQTASSKAVLKDSDGDALDFELPHTWCGGLDGNRYVSSVAIGTVQDPAPQTVPNSSVLIGKTSAGTNVTWNRRSVISISDSRVATHQIHNT